MHRQQQQQVKEVPRFREMSWLDPKHSSNAAASKPLLSPSALGKQRQKGVKPYTKELHSRFSSVGTHLMTKDQKPIASCGLSHEEENQARYQPDRRAVSHNQPGSERFQGPHTHFKRPASTTVPCGLSHDEASTDPKPVLSMRKDANLGGTEARFQGKRTHFQQSQGRGELLGQENLASDTRGNATIPKSNWLKNLWIVSGTALEDREMQQCDAMIAPVLPIHDNWLESASGSAVANMTKDTSKRFAYQTPSPLINLEYQTTTSSAEPDAKLHLRGAMNRRDKHSRFSMHGGYQQRH